MAQIIYQKLTIKEKKGITGGDFIGIDPYKPEKKCFYSTPELTGNCKYNTTPPPPAPSPNDPPDDLL